jgi:phytanoyl-CoA dioxygenase PhyH
MSAARFVQEFEQNGFLVLPNALSPSRIADLKRAVDDFFNEHPEQWVIFDESLIQTANVLPATSAFDVAIENPATLDLLRVLIGEDIALEELALMIRNPTKRARDVKGWHRDMTRDYDRRKEIRYHSLIYYLTDVSESDHCFSIVPESHNRWIDLRPEDIGPSDGFDVVGPAGTAVIFHGRCIHSGKLKPNSRQRRTIHVYFGRAGEPRTTEWTEIPARLHEKRDPALPPRLYSKWNVTEVLEGVGKKPRDLDPAMPMTEMIKEVQRRANKATV